MTHRQIGNGNFDKAAMWYGPFPSRQAAIGGISGCGSAAVTLTVCHPLDTMMVRIQREQGFRWTMDNVRRVLRNPYAGLPPHVAFYCSNGVLRFGTFDWARAELMRRFPTKQTPAWQLFSSGALAGCTSTIFLHPFMVMKTVMQANPMPMTEMGRKLWQTEGGTGFYRALHVGLLRNGLQIGVYFTVYEKLKQVRPTAAGGTVNFVLNSASGGLSGAICWMTAMPFIVAFSKLVGELPGQRTERSLPGALRTLIREDGMRGLYRGSFPAMLRAVPANAVLMPVCDLFRGMADASLP